MPQLRRFSLAWMLALGFSWAMSCAYAAPLRIVTSIKPLALLAADVAGDVADVQVLLPTNSDPHNFALKVSDRQRLQQAELVVWLGPEFERFLAKPLTEKPLQQQVILGDVAGLHWPPSAASHGPEAADHEGKDLHLWLDLDNAAVIAQAISARLQQLQPQQTALLAQRLAATLARLKFLDAQLNTAFTPLRSRAFGVYHDGYGHFVNHYGLQQRLSFSSLPEQHLSARQLESARLQLADASCVITDLTENNRDKLSQLLHLPVYVADPLAQARTYRDFTDYFTALQQVFLSCLTPVQ